MKTTLDRVLFSIAAVTAAAMTISTSVVAEGIATTNISVIGSSESTNMHKFVEQPFWTKTVPEGSSGAVVVDFKGLQTSGLKGPEILRLLSTGAITIAHGTFTTVAADDEIFNGIDLPGLAPTIQTARAISEAYSPVVADTLRKKHGLKLLAVLPFTSQVFFCSTPINGLDDLEGKKIRVYGRSLAELVEAAGATPVTIPFNEVVPALQTGVADCAITGITAGNTAKWYEVAKYLYNLPTGWAINFYAANADAWNALAPEARRYLETAIDQMKDDVWAFTAEENQFGVACNTGQDPCQYGVKADMKLTSLSSEDKEALDRLLLETVIPNWAQRCGAECTRTWNDTVGKVVNMSLPIPD
ncbi:TRAP transporter substrate-binding protein [Pelagibius sp.]|uniref:TRAP transporter substrate-binding protein n=1 Tax=Pelagibius sp. TaxID=1931238 RepID=UPI003BAEA72F